MEFNFNRKRAALVKENLDLKDKMGSFEEAASRNQAEKVKVADEAKIIEEESARIKEKDEILRSEYEQLIKKYNSFSEENKSLAQQITVLKNKHSALGGYADNIEKAPLVQEVKGLIKKEQNDGIKNVSQDTPPQNVQPPPSTGQSDILGKIISIDYKNNLAVIDLGRRDRVKESDSCIILKDGLEFARGEVIKTGYNTSAIFINELKHKNTVADIPERSAVIIQSS